MWLTTTRGERIGDSRELTPGEITIGRDPSCEILIPDPRASRRHCVVRTKDDGTVEVEDLGSSNGTFVDEQKVEGPTPLPLGARLRVGDTVFRADETEQGPAPTQVGQAPPPPPGAPPPPPAATPGQPTPSTIERRKLRRGVRVATAIGSVAVVAVVVVAVLFATGVFSGDDGDDEADIPAIVEAVRPSTVQVGAFVDGEPQGSGTGWVLDADEGLIVTNQHVTNAGETFTVALDGGEEREATIRASAPCQDLALLEVEDTEGLESLPIGSQQDLEQGEEVVAVGFPASASIEGQLTATSGIVSVVETTFDEQSFDVPMYTNVIQTDTAINPGNSGGPLVNLDEELVGVNSAGIDLLGGRTIQGQGYAIGATRLDEVLPDMREGRSTAWTGMGFQYPADAGELTSLGLPPQAGLVVTHAVPGTNAAAAGFGEQPVLITAVDGEPIENALFTYCAAAGDVPAGEQITFTVFQPGSDTPQDVRVTVQDAQG